MPVLLQTRAKQLRVPRSPERALLGALPYSLSRDSEHSSFDRVFSPDGELHIPLLGSVSDSARVSLAPAMTAQQRIQAPEHLRRWAHEVTLEADHDGIVRAVIDLTDIPGDLFNHFDRWLLQIDSDRPELSGLEVIHIGDAPDKHTDLRLQHRRDIEATTSGDSRPSSIRDVGRLATLDQDRAMADLLARAPQQRVLAIENVRYFHWDHLGTPRMTTDETGAVLSRTDYWPYGVIMRQEGGDISTHKFTGHERDRKTGLDYMMARYYKKEIGRFLSVDPGTTWTCSGLTPGTRTRTYGVIRFTTPIPTGEQSAGASGSGQ